jgi:hypothetical protein
VRLQRLQDLAHHLMRALRCTVIHAAL